MKHGNKLILLFLTFIFLVPSGFEWRRKITSTPLINLENIKPSFEELDANNDEVIYRQNIKEKRKNKIYSFSCRINGS